MNGQTTGSSAERTSKKRPLRIAGQLVGPFTTGCALARPAVPTGSRIATDGSGESTVAAGGGKAQRRAARGGLRERRLVGRKAQRIDQVVHALEPLHPHLEPLALRADLLE